MNRKQLMAQFVRDMVAKAGLPPKGKSATRKLSPPDMHITLGRKLGAEDYYVIAEWYVPESHDDDDGSYISTSLPPKMGSARRALEVRGSNAEELLAELEAKR